jgi:hypothetical protein
MSTIPNESIKQLIAALQVDLCQAIYNSQREPYSPAIIEQHLSQLVLSADAICDELENIDSAIRQLNKTVEASATLLTKAVEQK